MSLVRTRWAAIGAAVAVTLGAGGISLSQAAISSGDKPVFVALDAPCRVVDTRESTKIGPGDDESLDVQITGENRECTGPLTIPADAVAVATNVTVIQPSDSTSGRSYFTVYPTGAARPVTSNLNFVNGQAPTPNKVDVGIGTGGQITIYNDEGTAHAAVDIFGYYVDHHHDDRYYTEAEVDAAVDALPDVLSATVEAGIPPTLVRGVGATAAVRLSTGNYRVEFDRDVSACTYVASAGEHASGVVDDTAASTAPDVADTARIVVRVFDVAGNPTDESFHLIVVCPT